MWQCKKHGKGCQSYVAGFCYDLNMACVQPSDVESMCKRSKEDKIMFDMVEWVEEKSQRSKAVK